MVNSSNYQLTCNGKSQNDGPKAWGGVEEKKKIWMQ